MRTRSTLAAVVALATASCGGGTGGSPIDPVIEEASQALGVAGIPLTVIFTGKGFGGALSDEPMFTVARVRDLDGNLVDGPSDSARLHVQVTDGREQVGIVVDTVQAPLGVYSVTLVNGWGRSTSFADAFAILPTPRVESLDRSVLCADGAGAPIGAAGGGLPILSGVATGAELRPDSPATAPPVALSVKPSGCRAIPFARADLSLCTRLEATLPAGTAGRWNFAPILPAGFPEVPPPSPLPLLAEPPPAVVGGAGNPAPVSVEDGPFDFPLLASVTSRLDGLLVATGVPPIATLDGEPVAARADLCRPSGFAGIDECERVWVTIPKGTAPGIRTAAITTTTGCSGGTTVALAPRPVVATIGPAIACANSPTDLVVAGSGFLRPSAFSDGQSLLVPVGCPGSAAALPLCSEISVEYSGRLGPGTHQLVIQNDTTPPVRSAPVSFTIAPGPATVHTPEPATVYCNAGRTVGVQIEGVTDAPAAVWIEPILPPGPAVTDVTWTWGSGAVQLTLPVNLPANTYRILVQDGSPCVASGYSVYALADAALVSHDYEQSAVGTWFGWMDGTTTGVHPLDVVPGAGNPGGAVVAGSDGGPAWAFVSGFSIGNADLGVLRFDLRETSTGTPTSGPDVVFDGWGLFTLEYTLPSPPLPGWNGYALRLDDPTGWTFVDTASGERRAATLIDFQGQLTGLRIRGMWASGSNEAALDNLAIDLAL